MRSALPPSEQQHLSRLALQHLYNAFMFLRSQHIAFYFASKGEIDPILLFQKATQMGKHCYFPILHPIEKNRMLFGSYVVGDSLKKNVYDIFEPDLNHAQLINPALLDIVITPLIAFDDAGNRLGMGGGFYDRTFSFLNHKMHTKPTLIGLAYEFQRVASLKTESWDVCLDLVVTEKQVYDFRANHK